MINCLLKFTYLEKLGKSDDIMTQHILYYVD